MKEYLKKKWSTIYKKYKKGAEPAKEKKKPQEKKEYRIPYMPFFKSTDDDDVKDEYVRKLVTKLQTEKGPDGK